MSDSTDMYPLSSEDELFPISAAALAAQPSLSFLMRSRHEPCSMIALPPQQPLRSHPSDQQCIPPAQDQSHHRRPGTTTQPSLPLPIRHGSFRRSLSQQQPPSQRSLQSSMRMPTGSGPSRPRQSLRSVGSPRIGPSTPSVTAGSPRVSTSNMRIALQAQRPSTFYTAGPSRAPGPLPGPATSMPSRVHVECPDPVPQPFAPTNATTSAQVQPLAIQLLADDHASPAPLTRPAKRRRVEDPAVEAARGEAKSRDPLSLTEAQRTDKEAALEGVASLTALINFDIIDVQSSPKGPRITWRCRCCHVTVEHQSGVLSNVSRHFNTICRRRNSPLTPGFIPFIPSGRLPPTKTSSLDAVPPPLVPSSQNPPTETPSLDEGQTELIPIAESASVVADLKTTDGRFSLFVEDRDQVGGTALGIFAVWMDPMLRPVHVCLLVVSLSPGRQGDLGVAGVLTRLGMERYWSGFVVAHPTDVTRGIVSELRRSFPTVGRTHQHLSTDLPCTRNIQLVPTLQSRLEGILMRSEFDTLLAFQRPSPRKAHITSGSLDLLQSADESEESDADASPETVTPPVHLSRIGSPGHLADTWTRSAAIHAANPMHTPSLHPTAKFLSCVDRTMIDIWRGRIASADVLFVADTWESCIRQFPAISCSVSGDVTRQLLTEASLTYEITQLRRDVPIDELARVATLLRDPPLKSDFEAVRYSEAYLLRALDHLLGVVDSPKRDKEVTDFLSGRYRSPKDVALIKLSSAIDWWSSNARVLPQMARLARTILAFPAGFTRASDRALQAAGYELPGRV
ncbi:hypothetical protein CF328_g4338 [Tilletia controversa]|nr:hypothetical protein CF328_g4338 [Tilletia controversa]